MRRPTWEQAGIAATILLAPGGFVLGLGLAARWWWARGRPGGGDGAPRG